MIVSVCLNAAWDVTYEVGQLTVGDSHRVHAVVARAGGKGVNVARALHQLGADVVLMGMIGGPTGAAISADLMHVGIPNAMTAVAGDSRRTVTIVDAHDATVFNEPGPAISHREWAIFTAAFAECVASAGVVVLSGSLPPGVPAHAYSDLTDRARATGALVIVDADGEALHTALPAHPDVVKPNAHEAAELLGRPTATRRDALAAARTLVMLGPHAAVVSRGAAGLVAAVSGQAYSVRTRQPAAGDPTGAGDVLTALIAHGLATSQTWPQILRAGVAAATAAVASPHRGEFDPDHAAGIYAGLILEEH